jgi:hypothetical protein
MAVMQQSTRREDQKRQGDLAEGNGNDEPLAESKDSNKYAKGNNDIKY